MPIDSQFRVMEPDVPMSTSFKPCKGILFGEHAFGTGSLSDPDMGVQHPQPEEAFEIAMVTCSRTLSNLLPRVDAV
jgi:hypothetical protein